MWTYPLRPVVQVTHHADDLAEGQHQQRVIQRCRQHPLNDPQDILLRLHVVGRKDLVPRRWRDLLGQSALGLGLFILPERSDLIIREIDCLHDFLTCHEGLGRLLRDRCNFGVHGRRWGAIRVSSAATNECVFPVHVVGDTGLVEHLKLAFALFLEE